MPLEYVHQKIGEEVQALAGYYTVTDEIRLKLDGREILCIIGICAIEASCCGNRSFKYALVPGYVVTWKGKKDKSGRPVSEVEPVTDEAVRKRVEVTLKDTQTIFKPNIEFW
jgi:hypothetical protein